VAGVEHRRGEVGLPVPVLAELRRDARGQGERLAIVQLHELEVLAGVGGDAALVSERFGHLAAECDEPTVQLLLERGKCPLPLDSELDDAGELRDGVHIDSLRLDAASSSASMTYCLALADMPVMALSVPMCRR